jgi:hypothetical protein
VSANRDEVRLYGTDIHDEWLEATPEDAIEYFAEFYEGRPLPYTGRIREYNILPPGDSGNNRVMDGSDVAEHVADVFGDDCGFERLFDEYAAAAKDPEVIAAFQTAVDMMRSRQKFLVADKVTRTGSFTILSFVHGSPVYQQDWPTIVYADADPT